MPVATLPRWLFAILSACLLAVPVALAQDIGEDFALTATDGRRIDPDALRGAPYVLFFGFTHCPDVCPLTLAVLIERLEELGPEADDLGIVFVTVDPARDTAEHLAEYLGWFDHRIIGLRGAEAETAATARAFRATYRKVPLEGGDYSMDHTAALYLMDANGEFFGRLDYRDAPARQIETLRNLLASAAAGP